MQRTLAQWLEWQESLSPREIDLGLDRVDAVAGRLGLTRPAAVFTVAGTNGKGSTAAHITSLLAAAGRRTGTYTSPHLVHYNERIRIAGQPIADDALVEVFERVEAARGAERLTYFEFGTLAALLAFEQAGCDAWVLEVGLGGRLDAVNAIDPDVGVITTVDLDHQQWLGDTVEAIAAEKAGIMRAGRVTLYGDTDPPATIAASAAKIGAVLRLRGRDFRVEVGRSTWAWFGHSMSWTGLERPPACDALTLGNVGLAAAAIEAFDPAALTAGRLVDAARAGSPPGRFQRVTGDPEWILDVAHNQQAAAVLCRRLESIGRREPTVAVAGMLGDKQIGAFAQELANAVDCWIIAPVAGPRAADAMTVARAIAAATGQRAEPVSSTAQAFTRAAAHTPASGRIVVCGSFRIVGPALQWLGLY